MLKRILKKVKKIDLETKNKIDSLFSGNYRSVFYGRGIEFADLRKYDFGDDVRDIDWNASSRTNQVMVKQYQESRDNTLFFIFDMSFGIHFSSLKKKKYETLLETFAILAFAAVKNGDKVGAIFLDNSEKPKIYKPKKGKKNVLKILSDAIYIYENFDNERKIKENKIEDNLNKITKILKHSAVIFWLSSEIPEKMTSNFKKSIKIIKAKNDFIPIIFSDPQEKEILERGMVDFIDPISQKQKTIYLTDEIAANFKKYFQEEKERFLNFFRKYRIESIFIDSQDDVYKKLFFFFKKRQRDLI